MNIEQINFIKKQSSKIIENVLNNCDIFLFSDINPYKKFRAEKCNISNEIWDKIILLPSHPSINKKDQKKQIESGGNAKLAHSVVCKHLE